MPINLTKIDELLDKYTKERIDADQRVSRLQFVREKILHGTEDEKTLILIISQMTIESVEETMKALKDSMDRLY